MGIKTAEGQQIFKTRLYFFKFLNEFSQRYIVKKIAALHAIRGFRMQFALKGI